MPPKYDETTVQSNLNTLSLTVNTKMTHTDIIFSEELIKETRKILKTINTKKLKEYNQQLENFELIINRSQLVQTNNSTSLSNNNLDNSHDEVLASGQRGIDSLRKSIATLEEAEKNGADTMEELLRQREILNKARNNLDKVDENINDSQRILYKMSSWWRRITS